jgi:uncharacterized protein
MKKTSTKKTLTRIGIFTLILLVGFYIYLSWFFSGLILHPDLEQRKERVAVIEDIRKNGPKPGSAMAAIKAPYEEFELKTEDGTAIKGWHFSQSDTPTCAAIISHGWTSSRVGALNFAHVFDSCGCDIVVYDHRVHGESTGDFAGGGDIESKDLIAITDWLIGKTGLKDNQIGWVGISWGGATVLEAGGTGREMAFIWADAPFQDWHTAIFERAIRDYGGWVKMLPFGVYAAYKMRTGFHPNDANAAEAAKNIKIPVFLFHSKTDEATGSQQSVNINKNLNPEKSVFVHGEWGGLHGKDIVDNKEVYSASFYNFLKKYAPNFGNCQE